MDEPVEYRKKKNFAKKINIHSPVKVNASMDAMMGVWVTGKYDPDYPPMIHCYLKMGRDSFGANFTSANEMIEFYQNLLEWYTENQEVIQKALDEVWSKRHKYKKLENEMKREELQKGGIENVNVVDFK